MQIGAANPLLGRKEKMRQDRVGRYQRSLYRFCTEILKYDKLSEKFHKPKLAKWDEIDARRMASLVGGGSINIADEAINTFDAWARDHIKTWCMRARVIRYYLWMPSITVTWWHAVEDKALESGYAIAQHLLKNKELRALFPEGVLPGSGVKRFFTNGEFSLRSRKIGDGPSLSCMGAGGEGTGGHSIVGVLDDVLGYNDVVENQMEKKLQWYQATVSNVVRSEGWKDAIGTRWPGDSLYEYFLSSPHWSCSVSGCLETEGKPDYQGEPVYLTRDQIERKRDELQEMFPYQMMNDPSPSGKKPWKEEKERWLSYDECRAGLGTVVVLGDPAPANVGTGETREARRASGEKDDWAWAVVKLRRVGIKREIILLDGLRSKAWDMASGFEAGCELQKKWGARHLVYEMTGPLHRIYEDAHKEAARKVGTPPYSGVKLEEYNKANAKNAYFGALCSALSADEFAICSTCNKDFLDEFLKQARGWMPVGKANTLKHDDCANAVSFVTDPEIRRLSPVVGEEWSHAHSPYRREVEEEYQGGRYIHW